MAGVDRNTTQDLLQQFQSPSCAMGTSIGLEKGKWKTGKLKEYAEKLCYFLASLVSAWLRNRRERVTTPPSLEWLRALHVKDMMTTAPGPDFNPHS